MWHASGEVPGGERVGSEDGSEPPGKRTDCPGGYVGSGHAGLNFWVSGNGRNRDCCHLDDE